MRSMEAVTAIELEAARRREVALGDARSARFMHEKNEERPARASGNPLGSWLPILAATVRLARG